MRVYRFKAPGDRFWEKVNLDGPEGCWTWTAALSRGYGHFTHGRSGSAGIAAHTWAYEALVGPVPAGMTLDHVCHNPETCVGGPTCPHRACPNPAHLEPTTRGDNARRGVNRNAEKTACKNGHEFTLENTLYQPKGSRYCRTCANQRAARYYRQKAMA